MKLRALFVVLFGMVVVAVGLWFWPAGGDQGAEAPTENPIAAAPAPIEASAPPPVQKEESRPPAPTPPPRYTSAVMPGEPLFRSSPAPVKPVAPRPAASGPPAPRNEEPPEKRDLEDVRAMFGNYRTRIGENPVGTNAEIMRAVMGGNRAGARLGPPDGQSLNGQGELVDRWGTAYFFHQVSKTEMEIRSAGPDQTMWTPDDIVTK